MKSKRRALRLPCGRHQVSYKTAYDAGEAVLLNVSTVGCAFEQPSLPLSMQEKVLVSIALLGEDSVIQAQGVVVRVENGLTAIRFIADHKALIGGQDMVTYAYFLATDQKMGQVFFKTDRDSFERLRPVFDSIASSIQMK